jgi:hypothetical protein
VLPASPKSCRHRGFGADARSASSRLYFARYSSPCFGIPESDVLFAGRPLRSVRQRLNLFTSEVQPDLVGQMLKFVGVNGHDFGTKPKPPTDVNLDGVNSAVRALIDLDHLTEFLAV